MKNSYDSLNDTFKTDPVESTEIVKEQKRKEQIQKLTDDVSKDYDYTRGNLYSLIEKDKKLSMVLWKLQVKLQVQEHMKLQVN